MNLKQIGAKQLIAASTTAIALTGCTVVDSSAIQSEAVYQNYRVRADLESGELDFEAYFTVDGSFATYIELDGQSYVTIDGRPMNEEKSWLIDDVRYRHTRRPLDEADLRKCYTFYYVGNEGDDYSNCVWPTRALNFRAEQQRSARIGDSLLVKWETDQPVTLSEGVEAILSTSSGSASGHSNGGGRRGEVRIRLPADQSLSTGTARLQLCRTKGDTPTQATEAGGYIHVSTCSRKIEVYLSYY